MCAAAPFGQHVFPDGLPLVRPGTRCQEQRHEKPSPLASNELKSPVGEENSNGIFTETEKKKILKLVWNHKDHKQSKQS